MKCCCPWKIFGRVVPLVLVLARSAFPFRDWRLLAPPIFSTRLVHQPRIVRWYKAWWKWPLERSEREVGTCQPRKQGEEDSRPNRLSGPEGPGSQSGLDCAGVSNQRRCELWTPRSHCLAKILSETCESGNCQCQSSRFLVVSYLQDEMHTTYQKQVYNIIDTGLQACGLCMSSSIRF